MGIKTKYFVATAATLLLLSISALGQQGKIGFVNSQEVLYGTQEGQEGLAALDQFMAGKRQEFETRNKTLADLQQDYQAKQRSLNPDALRDMESRIEQQQRELRRFEEDAQLDFNQRQSQLLQNMSGKVQTVIEQFAQQNSFAAIFMRDNTQAYVSPSLDVTQQIIGIYNQTYPGKSPQSPQTPQTPPPGN